MVSVRRGWEGGARTGMGAPAPPYTCPAHLSTRPLLNCAPYHKLSTVSCSSKLSTLRSGNPRLYSPLVRAWVALTWDWRVIGGQTCGAEPLTWESCIRQCSNRIELNTAWCPERWRTDCWVEGKTHTFGVSSVVGTQFRPPRFSTGCGCGLRTSHGSCETTK